MGEDVGEVGGVFRATEGLYEKYGADRIRDTPVTESGFVGCGVGAALTGMRPVVELQFSDFHAVRDRPDREPGGEAPVHDGRLADDPARHPAGSGGGVRLAAQHSQSLEALFAHVPGLSSYAVEPIRCRRAPLAAILDDNPVMFLEQKLLFFAEAEPVPEERYSCARQGERRAAGADVTVVALGAMVPRHCGRRPSSSARGSTSR